MPKTTPESMFTMATSLCPFPERWSAPDRDATEVEVSDFVWGLIRCLQPSFCVEAGTYHGHTTKRIGEALLSNGHGRLTTIDNNQEALEIARNYVERYPMKLPVDFVLADDGEWAPTRTIDFAWLDSDKQGRFAAFRNWWPYFSHRTIVAIHDTAPKIADVHAEAKKLIEDGLIKGVFFPTPRGVFVGKVIKPREPGGPA